MSDLSTSLPLIILVTDRHLVHDPQGLYTVVQAAVDGGINAVQLRERDLPDAEQLDLANELRRITDGKALLFINDSGSVAQASHADGVHLSDRSRTVADARARAADASILVGRSVHDTASAKEAADQGADLIIASNVFESHYDPEYAPAGVDLIKELSGSLSIPVIGAGGVSKDNAAGVVTAGGVGVAVTRSIMGADDPKSAAQALVAAVRAAEG
ncbi:MAG: thiamine phosphate synthase [Planctomycetota bacterium]|jgi:thiamine-phosphate pyrophosphorylase